MELVELEGDHTDDERAQLIDGEHDVYEIGHLVLPPGRPRERRFVLREDGRLIASAGMLIADVEVADTTFPIVGIGGVLVTHTRRGQGLFRQVVEPVIDHAERLGPDFALLFCIRKNAPLYAKFGFHTIAAPVTSTGIEIPLDTMWRPLRRDAQWPAGPVTLLGPMF